MMEVCSWALFYYQLSSHLCNEEMGWLLLNILRNQMDAIKVIWVTLHYIKANNRRTRVVLPPNIRHATPAFYMCVHKRLMDNGCCKNDELLRWVFKKIKGKIVLDVHSLRDITAADTTASLTSPGALFVFF